jgi:hypothetical protein
MMPAKKNFTNVQSKLDTGVKKTTKTKASRQSNDLTVKKKVELYGRVGTELVAKFLTKKISQYEFIAKMKGDVNSRLDDRGTDFNYSGYQTNLSHEVRINKRPLTAFPQEKFGDFTQNLFSFGENG